MPDNTMKIPKRIPITVLRQILGDARTEDFLTTAYGPKLLGPREIIVQKQAFENALEYMEGKAGKHQAYPGIFRLYYRESPQAKGRFKMWLRKKIAEYPEDGPEANGSGVAEAAAQMTADTTTVKPTRRRRGRPTNKERSERREKVRTGS